MKIVEIAPVTAVNPFAEDIAGLIEASETTPNAAGQWEVSAADAGKTKFKLARAANDQQRTASLVSETTSKDGSTVTLTYRIKPRVKSTTRTRKATEDTTVE